MTIHFTASPAALFLVPPPDCPETLSRGKLTVVHSEHELQLMNIGGLFIACN